MSNIPSLKMNNKPKSNIASKIPTSGRDSGTHSRSSSVSNLTTASDLHSEMGDAASDSTEDFKIDERVWVNGTKPGVIKFIGKTQFAPGVWAGILLDELAGKNDGSVAGVKYFTCEPLRGIFARPSKLTRTAGPVSGVGDSTMVGAMTTPPKSTIVPSGRTSVASNVSSSGSKYTKLRVGEKIAVSSLSGLKSGTLRFIGETDFAKGEWAGIELDEPTGKNDGSVAGKRYFTCELKYGLFAPLHKVSRPGATPVSRPGSVRGTPLLRSNSRDSLSSSVSNTSRSSRVKLGITSLTSAQKARVSGGIGYISATKVLEDAIKEKDQHIEQLLKERELDRAEFARLANHFEQVGAKSTELEEKQKAEASLKKSLEEQLATFQKKFEDIQFQLEEEKITKTEFETQLQQKSQILKHIEEYISKESGDKFLNIKGILSGQEASGEIRDTQVVTGESEELQKKIAELEATVKLLTKQKNEIQNKLTELQNSSGENSERSDPQIETLNTVIQEKDDMIINLKNELNSNIEKVTQLIEDNKNLSEQMLLKEEQAKGHADDVIKELGQTVNSLSEQLKTQSSELAEHITSIEDKDNKIKSLEQSLKDQTAASLELQNELKLVNDALKLKESQCEENIAAQKSLEETVMALRSESETYGENQKKINLLEEEIKTKSGLLNNYLSSIEEKENLISSLQQNFDSQAAALLQLQNEKKDLSESLKLKESELTEKAAKQKSLEEQIASLTAHNESSTSEKEKKMLDLVKEIEKLTNCVQEKEEQLLKIQNELNNSNNTIEKLNVTIQQLSEKIQQADLSLATTSKEAAEKINSLQNNLCTHVQEKSDMKSEYERELSVLKTTIKVQEDEIQAKTDTSAQLESQVSELTEKLKKNSDESEKISEKKEELMKEMEILGNSLTEKDEVIADFSKQVEILKNSLDKSNLSLENNTKELQSLKDSLNVKEEEINQLTSKLQLAEQKVEMLNKDSSDHVMALQNELSKIKEESTTTKTHLEQELLNVKNKNEKLSNTINEKEKALLEKEDLVTSLQSKLKDSETVTSDLSTQNAELLKNISKFSMDIEEREKIYNEKLSSSVTELNDKLKAKDQELLIVKNNNEKLSNTINEKEKALLEKEDLVTSLQSKLKDSETVTSDLSTQNAELLKNISKFSMDIEEREKICNEKLSSSVTELNDKLKGKDQIIQDIQNELKKYTDLLENKSKELNSKDGEISVLKNIIQEKESQFDELSKMVESSQNQLALLKERNEKNESLLQSKESFITEFKTDQENQLQLKEQSFKEETSRLENLLQSKNEEINSKEAHISNLLKEIEDKKKFVDSLQTELDTAKSDKQKISNDSSNIYQELNNRVMEMEEKYSKLLEEKEKIAKEELQAKDAKKNLEQVRDTLLQEKSVQEEIVKDKETKLEALQAEVNRMQAEFSQHKQDLQQKLDVSEVELQAALELKNQLDIQHNVIEELQQELHNSGEKCKKLETQVQMIPTFTSEKNQLQAQIEEFQKVNKEKSETITKMEEKYLVLEEQLNNNKNLMLLKEKELSSLKEQLKKKPSDKVSSDLLLKSLEDENVALKNKIALLELEKKSDTSTKTSTKEISSEDDEKTSLIQQIDFLNSIIVDLKQKNEKLTDQLEAQTTCWEESDINLNETTKAIAPRLFCDICEVFDLHETDDCPKQESFLEEAVPQLRRPGTRQLEERPYCNNCEMFGHWTLDCEEPETF